MLIFALFLGSILLLTITYDTLTASPNHQHSTTPLPPPIDLSNLPPWEAGLLDIHHIRSGPSVSTFCVFPDGTTLLIDAGAMNPPTQLKVWSGTEHSHRRILDVYPDKSKAPGGWILAYLERFWPRRWEKAANRGLDYALITHFHTDHVGDPTPQSEPSTDGKFIRSGITEIGDQMPIETLLDRGYPNYDLPRGGVHDHESLANYVNFVDSVSSRGITDVQKFEVGSNDQIRMKRNQNGRVTSHFRVRNVKSNLEVVQPPAKNGTAQVVPIQNIDLSTQTLWDENELSNAIVIEYGNFRYFEGGDTESHTTLPDGSKFDAVTPTSIAAGPVDVATLNHHGHGVNTAFTDIMDPAVLILQGWCSDHPPREKIGFLAKIRKRILKHPDGDGASSRKRRKRDIFATDMFQDQFEGLNHEARNLFRSTGGHVMVRVGPPEEKKGKEGGVGVAAYTLCLFLIWMSLTCTYGPYAVKEK